MTKTILVCMEYLSVGKSYDGGYACARVNGIMIV